MADLTVDAPLVLDRSTLEAFHVCPEQGRQLFQGLHNTHSRPAVVGGHAHDCLSFGLQSYVETGNPNAYDIVSNVLSALHVVPPLYREEVEKSLRPSLNAWARWLSTINPLEILHYDGGDGDRSGQLSHDVKSYGTVRLTSELDFVRAGLSKEALEVYDWKTGWKQWNYADVFESFQFRMHAWLLWGVYEQINYVTVRVWNTRFNDWTAPIEFTRRKHHDQIDDAILSAAEAAVLYGGKETPAPLRPEINNCRLCDAAGNCPASGLDAIALAEDPAAFLDHLVAISAKKQHMVDALTVWSDHHGEVESDSGARFGRDRPKQQRKAPAELY